VDPGLRADDAEDPVGRMAYRGGRLDGGVAHGQVPDQEVLAAFRAYRVSQKGWFVKGLTTRLM